MYLATAPEDTCAKAWLSAVLNVNAEPGHEAFNVIIDVANPTHETRDDLKIITLLDDFLVTHDAQPLQSVANTIFPYSIYKKYGSPEFYNVYLDKIYPRVKKNEWGRYFERMINYQVGGDRLNPLAELIDKLKQALIGKVRTFHNIYELGIYDPARDANRRMNRQCLSFLSFKLDSEKRVLLTAVYRNHFYIARLLGNMIGLARLMEFISIEAGSKVGSLTIVSTHAEVDTFKWNRSEVNELIATCGKV